MKIALISTAMAGILAVSAFSTPSFAQDYRGDYGYRDGPTPCQQVKRSNSTAGTLFGGILGAVVGSNLAHGGGRTGGAVIGGLAGAALGSNIARSSADNSEYCQGGVYSYAPPPPAYRYEERYSGYDRYAPPPPPPGYYEEGDD
jgi:hypothetical protein